MKISGIKVLLKFILQVRDKFNIGIYNTFFVIEVDIQIFVIEEVTQIEFMLLLGQKNLSQNKYKVLINVNKNYSNDRS